MKLAINRFDADSEIGRKDVERVLGGTVAYTFPSDYRAAVAALNKGEPVVNGQQGRLPRASTTPRGIWPACRPPRRTPSSPACSAGSADDDRQERPRLWQFPSVHAW